MSLQLSICRLDSATIEVSEELALRHVKAIRRGVSSALDSDHVVLQTTAEAVAPIDAWSCMSHG
jgi:hypothetical protein